MATVNVRFLPQVFASLPNMPSRPPSRATNLASSTATVALGSARALTSHVRNLYVCNYLGKCKHPRTFFAIDAALLFLAATLVGIASWFAFLPPPSPELRLTFAAPPLVAGVPVPLSATIRSADGLPHSNVRLHWRLPPGTQVLSSDPSLSADGSMIIGSVLPGQDVSAHIIVRLFVPPGGNVDFELALTDGGNIYTVPWTGTERRPIVGSGLIAEVPEEFRVSAIAAEGVVIPLRIENQSDVMLPSVSLQIQETPSHAEERILLGDLAPRGTRWVMLPLRRATDGSQAARLSWSMGAASRNMGEGSWEARIVAVSDTPQPDEALISRPGSSLEVPFSNLRPASMFLVMHPLLADPIRRVVLNPTTPTLVLPSPENVSGPNHEWFVAPLIVQPDGTEVLGPASMGVIAGGFPFETRVRYTSSAGDQLGAGPHPPQAGTETRYWVFWTVGPVDTELQNVVVSTNLPVGVTATGNVTAADGGSFRVSGRSVQWTLPSLTSSDGIAESGTATFGFEISSTPRASDVGSLLDLVATSTARADDVQTSQVFSTTNPPKTSWLSEDGNDQQKGIVLPST